MRNPDIKMRLAGLFVLLAAVLGAGPAGAACWQWSHTAAANGSADPSINFSEGQAPSTVNDSARALMARLAECRDDLSGALLTTGTATAYAVTTNQGLNSPPVDGQQIVVRLNLANGVAATLAADGGTAYAIQSAPGSAVASGTLVAGTPYRLTFNLASTAWVLQDFYNAPVAVHSVTYNKIQQESATSLLGNPTGAPADVQEIALGSGLIFVGAVLTPTVSSVTFPGYISGLTMGTAGASASFSVGTGAANDVTAAGMIVLGSAITKTTSAWAVGSGNGALDNLTIANSTWYHAFIIKRPDTGVVDACVSTSATGCAAGVGNIPAAYTLKRRIGSMLTTAGGQWVAFAQTADQFLWLAGVVDASAVAATTSRVNRGLTVPPGVVVEAMFRAQFNFAGNNGIVFTSLQENDQDPLSSTFIDIAGSAAGVFSAGNFRRLTNTSGQIGVRSAAASGSYSINTYGWIDTRGKN